MKKKKVDIDRLDAIGKCVDHVNGVFSILSTLAMNNTLGEAAKRDPQGLSCIFEDAQNKLIQIQEEANALVAEISG